MSEKELLRKIWNSMNHRCSDKSNKYYGGRGIKVCRRWRKSFDNFYNDMGERPGEGFSLDRIDNNKDYSPENCRWATAKEQQNNTNVNINITLDDKTMTLAQWCEFLDLKRSTVSARLNKGMSHRDALTQPTRRAKKYKVDGKDMTLRELCVEYGINISTVRSRLKRSWSIKAALVTPSDWNIL